MLWKNNEDILLILTACVNPNGMTQTVLQNAKIRLQQYKEAIDFYLKKTPYKILVVENTGYDFLPLYRGAVASGRMECLTFFGNDFDKSLGKGYGEGLILSYAFKEQYSVKLMFNHLKTNELR